MSTGGYKGFFRFHEHHDIRLLRMLSGAEDVSHVEDDQALLAGDPIHEARAYAEAEMQEHNGRDISRDEEDATDLG
jgi:hypothetical protein